MNINTIRANQSHQQSIAINQIRSNPQIATYQTRDNQSGDRILQSADGGTLRATYLSTTQPNTILTVKSTALSIPGYIIST